MERVLVDENGTESRGVDAPIPETEGVDAWSFAPLTERSGHQHPRMWSPLVFNS